MKTLGIALIVALGTSACAGRTTYICPNLPEPPRPPVPQMMPGALSCIADADAAMLAERERRLVEFAETMEVIISTHNKNCIEYRGRND